MTPDKQTVYVDRSPEGHAQQASQTFSGEVFSEYGIVDLQESFPAKPYEWRPEYPDADAREDADIDPEDVENGDVEVAEQHVVVPFRVVRRGLKTRRNARDIATEMNEDEGHDRYKAVLLSDMRGL
jgi:hypothetical protein